MAYLAPAAPLSRGGNPHAEVSAPGLTVSRDAIIHKLRKYGFTEIATVVHFLVSFCDDVPDHAAYIYIKEKLAECLDIHDNSSDYFIEIHQLIDEIDHVIACAVHE